MSVTNQVLDPSWSERVTRVRLGIGAIDALGRPGVIAGLGLHLEDVPRLAALPPAPRPVGDDAGLPGVGPNPSGRFALAFPVGTAMSPAGPDHVAVRIVDRARRYVPRRFSIPAPTLTTVTDDDVAHAADPTHPLTPRAFRPVLYPGANYGVAAGATALRGVVRSAADGMALPWARVVVRTAQSIDIVDDDGNVTQVQPVLGHAHGDDRGEFLLVVGTLPRDIAVLNMTPTIDLEVEVLVAPPPPVGAPVDSPTGSRRDPLWHLPVEQPVDLDPADPVTVGVAVPANHTVTTTQVVTCRRGSVTRSAVPFLIP